MLGVGAAFFLVPPGGMLHRAHLPAHVVPLARPSLDWYNADAHVHTSCDGETFTEPPALFAALQRSRSNIGNVLIWGKSLPHDADQYRAHADHPLSTANTILHWDLELSALPGDDFGHLLFLNLGQDAIVREQRVAYPLALLNEARFDWARAQGGVAGYAHGGFWQTGKYSLTPNAFSWGAHLAPWGLPIDITGDRVDFLATELVTYPFNRGFLWLWYQMLDAGFHLAPVAGSDYPCLLPLARVGRVHTAFGLAPGEPLSFKGYVLALLRHRVQVRTGWMPEHVSLNINRQPVGDWVFIDERAAEVEVTVEASSPLPLQWVELVMNGKVIRTARIDAALKHYHWRVPVARSSWLAARTRRAHSAASFVIVNGCPVRNSAAAAWQWRRYVDEFHALVRRKFGVPPRSRTAAAIEQSKKVWERVAGEAGGAGLVCDLSRARFLSERQRRMQQVSADYRP